MSSKKSIGLSLSGGGARGIAHIGVLQAFQENDIEIDMISGTSAGSIIGALYAGGLDIEEIKQFTKIDSLLKIFKTGLPLNGLVKLDYLKSRLREYLPVDDFDSLNKQLFVAVTNLLSGKAEIISKGPLYDVVVASSSIPLIFKPIKMNGALYVDGGVMMNLPIKPLLNKVDHIIGVNLHPNVHQKPEDVQNIVGIAQRVFDIAIQANSLIQTDGCDIVIAPEKLNDFSIFNFKKWDQLFEIGYEAGQEAVPMIKQFH